MSTRAMMKSRPVSQTSLTVAIHTVCQLVAPCFGPFGRDIAVRRDDGTVVITKEAEDVLREVVVEHPLTRFIITATSGCRTAHGDGGIRFLLLLSGFLSAYSTWKSSHARVQYLRALQIVKDPALWEVRAVLAL